MNCRFTMERRTFGVTATATVVLLMAASQPVDAALKLYEGFNTTALVELDGLGSGSGWGSNNWSTTEEVEGTNYFQTLGDAASIASYGGLDVNYRSAQRKGRAGKAEANRLWNFNAVRNTGNEVWFSVLTGYFSSGGNAAFAMTSSPFDPTESIAKLTDTVDTDLGLGLRYASGSEVLLTSWKDGVVNSNSATGLAVTPGETALLVGKINWNASGVDDEITLWKVPETGGSLDALGSITLALDMNNNILDRVALFDNERTIFDEIRFAVVEGGETSQDGLDQVAPGMGLVVPEPAGLALALVGGVAIIRRR